MRRRAYLTAAGAGLAALAGCSGGSGDGGGGPDVACSEIVPDADVTVCAGDENGPVSIAHQPAQWTVAADDGDRETMAVTVRNDGEEPLTFASPAWTLKRRTGSGWSEVASAGGEYGPLQSGAAFTWSLAESGRAATGTAPENTAWEAVQTEGGVHAFVVEGELGDRTVAAGAAFAVQWRSGGDGGTLGGGGV